MNRGAWRAPSIGSQRVGRNPVTIHAHIHPNGQSRKHLGTGNLHHMALAPARPGSEGPKATVSEVTAAKWRKTTIWPLETIKNVRLCLKVSPTPLFMYTSSESLHLPASAPDPQIPAQSTPVRRWAQTRCGQEDWHQQEGIMLFPLSQTESWEGCQGVAPHQLDRPVSIPGDQLRPFPSFLFRQKSPGVLAPGRQRVRKRCVLFGGR